MIFLPFILLRHKVQEFIKQQKVVLTVVGDLGQPGLHVHRPVGEEIRRERDCVTVQPRNKVVLTVGAKGVKRNSVTHYPVSC